MAKRVVCLSRNRNGAQTGRREQFAVADVRDPIHEVEELFIKVSVHGWTIVVSTCIAGVTCLQLYDIPTLQDHGCSL